MPMRNEPHSLERCAMLCIAHHFDHICYGCTTREQMHQMLEEESFLEVEGPFVSLPSGLLTKMVMMLMNETTLRHIQKKHLHILMQGHLEELKLCGGSEQFAVNLLTNGRCQRLRRLDLSYMRAVGPTSLINLLPSLTHLVTLKLSTTETVDQVLELVGRSCPELRELDVSQCPITDGGLYRLCYDQTTGKSLCQHLVSLKIIGCFITPHSVAFVLQHCPELAQLDFDRMFEVFEVLESNGISLDLLDGTCTFQLTTLTSTVPRVRPTSVDIACAICPKLNTISMANAMINNEVLYKFMTLEHLTNLQLTNCDGMTLDFLEGVLPVLTVKGEQLVSLILANFSFVDIGAIGECCPRLQNLALSDVTLFDELVYPRENLFTRLRVLELWSDVGVTSLTPVVLQQLVANSSNLHNILLRGVACVTDKLFFQLLESNKMRELSRLTLDSCPCISASTIHTLLDSANDLTLIRIWSCFLIGKQEQDDLQRRINEENCDLYLDWFPWQG
ncbi:uncharacterized protein LOC143040068 isoform X2 [Oratosquilla oratoria]|uniref:uncharacterized protein LOC143040068 isoform X2 n=1 Tax=Oratosquilla oratoria TaxID=337810 RepID=UPI003F76EC67